MELSLYSLIAFRAVCSTRKGKDCKLDAPVLPVEEATEEADGGKEGEQELQLSVHEEVEESLHVLVLDPPRHEIVLRRGGSVARHESLLLERPHIQQDATSPVTHPNQVLNRLELSVLVREVLDHGDTQHAVDAALPTSERWRLRLPKRGVCDAVLKQGALVGVGVLVHQEHLATVVLSQNDVSLRRVLLRVFQMLAHVLVVAAARVKENGCVVSREKTLTVTKGVDE